MQLIRILLDIVNMSTEIKVSPVVGVSPRVPAVTHIQDCVCVCVSADHKLLCPMGPGYGPDGLGL